MPLRKGEVDVLYTCIDSNYIQLKTIIVLCLKLFIAIVDKEIIVGQLNRWVPGSIHNPHTKY